MKIKGFTLIEMLGVIVIITLLTLLVLPNITNLIKGKENVVNETTKTLIYGATDLLITDNDINYPKINGNTFCIGLNELVNKDLLKGPITNFNKEDITNSYSVKMEYNNGFTYNLITNEECSQINAVNAAKKCANDGNCKTCVTIKTLNAKNYLNTPVIWENQIRSDLGINLNFNTYDFLSEEECINNSIIEAAKEYVKDNQSNFPVLENYSYCLSVQTLIHSGYLFIDTNNYSEILNKSISIIVSNNKLNYQITDDGLECFRIAAITAAKKYVGNNQSKFSAKDRNVYCLSISKLKQLEYLVFPYTNEYDDYISNYTIKISATNNTFDYEFTQANNCVQNINTICKAVIGGIEGETRARGSNATTDNEGNIIFTPGNEYLCDVTGTNSWSKRFFVLKENEETVSLLSYRYYRTYWYYDGQNTGWYYSYNQYGPVNAITSIHNTTKSWKIPNINIQFRDPANASNSSSGYYGIYTNEEKTQTCIFNRSASSNTDYDNATCFSNLKARLPYLNEILEAEEKGGNAWIRHHKNNEEDLSTNTSYSYWLLLDSSGTSDIKTIKGDTSPITTYNQYANSNYYALLVIEIPKTEFSI